MRQRTRPVLNPRLQDALAQTRWSLSQAAAAINRVGAENNITLTYGAASLAHWLTGTIPRAEAIPIVVETFARALSAPQMTAVDLGWPQPNPTGPGDPWSGDPVVWITQIGRDDMLQRRTVLTAGVYALSAAAIPAQPAVAESRYGTARRAGAEDVTRIRRMTETFSELDDLYGGGHARTLIASYLTSDVAPLLRGTTGRARPALFTAAAELTYLLAWMSADDRRTGLAQRYYIQSVRLADEASDATMRSTALRSLAGQAVDLGHASEGLALAEAAADSLRLGAPARKRAWVTGMCAEALAATGFHANRARELLRRAEVDLEHADSLPEHEWTGNYRRESYEHQVGLTLSQLGDHCAAERHYAASVATRRPVERRTKSLISAELACSQLAQTRPEAAAHTILCVADDLTAVSSARLHNALSDLRRQWQPYRPDPLVDRADRLIADTLRVAT